MRKRILIVDDNRDTATAFAVLISARGCDVRTAYDASSAIQIARTETLDAILLDIGLPGMDGFEAARQLHGLPGTTRPLIIAVTGYDGPLERERSANAGFDHHLTKPLDMKELFELLQCTP